MNPDAVVKIGGSLSRGPGLESLCREIGHLGKRHKLLIVPGGGAFADQVREADQKYHLDDTTAHYMALLAMDQYGYMLSRLIPGSFVTREIIINDFHSVPIFLPSSHIVKDDPLPHSWQVTSDTIAAWVAHRTNSNRLVLLKNVDGLKAAANKKKKLIAELTVEQLANHSGGIDGCFAAFLSGTRLETWIINGLRPERLTELMDSDRTTGTRVYSSTFIQP